MFNWCTSAGRRLDLITSFSLQCASMCFRHQPGWEQLLDNQAVHLLLSTYYSDGFLACGGGGDFVLPNTSTQLDSARDLMDSYCIVLCRDAQDLGDGCANVVRFSFLFGFNIICIGILLVGIYFDTSWYLFIVMSVCFWNFRLTLAFAGIC